MHLRVALHEAREQARQLPAAYDACVLALAGITLGTLYQKKFCTGMDLRTGSCVQLVAASVVALAPALLVEGLQCAGRRDCCSQLAGCRS